MFSQQRRDTTAVTLRSPRVGEAAVLIAARDDAFRRWLGAGSDDPSPTACIVVGGQVVGWVDYDHDPDHDWLRDGEVKRFQRQDDLRGQRYFARSIS